MGRTNLFEFPDSPGSAAVPLQGSSILDYPSFQTSSEDLTPFQRQVDSLVSSFIQQSTDVRTLSSLVAGGLAYRLGRIGGMAAGAGRLASMGIGLAAETSAFELTHRSFLKPTETPNLWRWEGAGGIRQGLLTSFITLGSLKGAGRLAQGENVIVQHLLQDTGMVLGHRTAGLFGVTPSPQGSLPEQFLQAEAVNLQLAAGLSLLHGGLPQLGSIEKSLDLTLKNSSSQSRGSSPSFRFLQPAYADGSMPHDEPSKRVGIYLSEGSSDGSGGSAVLEGGREAFRQRLEKKYGPALNAVYPPNLVSDAITTALDLPQSLQAHQGEFLTAFSRLGEQDSVSAHMTLLALRETLLRNALHTSQGSDLDARVQLFLESALTDPHTGRMLFAFRALHETLKSGLHRSKVENLLERFHYGKDYRISQGEASLRGSAIWEDRRKQEDPDFESQRALSLALAAAKNSPFPLIGLQRIDRILDAGEHPWKLSELAAEGSESWFSLERILADEDPPALAKKISGTSHTAFVDDIRLALATVEVLGKAYEYRFQSSFKISRNREELERRVWEFFQSGEALSPKKFMELLTFQGEKRFFQIRENWESGKFEIVLLPDGAFDEKARTSLLAPSRNVGLFDLRRGKGTPQILIRELSMEGTDTEEGYWDGFLRLTSRLSALVHEAERFRQMHPPQLSFGLLQLRPFDLASSDLHSRLVSGMMAALEEQLWRLASGLTGEWELADRAGGVLAYIRNEVDFRLER